MRGNGIVAQSGGPTAVINNSVCGVVHAWQEQGASGSLFGAMHGIKGVLDEKFVNLSEQSSYLIDSLRHTPGAALGSCRYRLQEEDYLKLLRIFQKEDIRYFYYIGGNDSMDTANKVHRLAQQEQYELHVIGIPKTVDNDLPFTDHCPGYGSAAKFLATTVMETGIDLKGLLMSKSVTIMEVMGRNTGWLAAATALAQRREDDSPHLIYLPETPFAAEQFLADVEAVYRNLGYVYVVASEGLVDKDGEYIFTAQGRDSFGHSMLGGLAETLKTLVEKEIGIKVRCNILGTAQRAAAHCASATDIAEAYMTGVEAVRMANEGCSGLMVTLERENSERYVCLTGSVELGRVANVEKTIPREWINKTGNGVCNTLINYVRPLIQGEVSFPTRDGLPDFAILDALRQRPLPVGEAG
jgi:ATP-dependent phosphofructokinase / diphosphate-dependent phosphofructokinase